MVNYAMRTPDCGHVKELEHAVNSGDSEKFKVYFQQYNLMGIQEALQGGIAMEFVTYKLLHFKVDEDFVNAINTRNLAYLRAKQKVFFKAEKLVKEAIKKDVAADPYGLSGKQRTEVQKAAYAAWCDLRHMPIKKFQYVVYGLSPARVIKTVGVYYSIGIDGWSHQIKINPISPKS